MYNKDQILNETKTKTGANIILRCPKPEDAKEMIEYFNIVGGESENLMFGANEFKLSIEDEEKYIKSINADENSLMVIGFIDGRIIAVGQIVASNRKRIAHTSQVSLSVKKEYWNEGIGSLLMSEFVKFAKSNGITKNINLTVNAQNYRGIALYKKFNFEEIGTHKNNININGKFYDEIVMDLYI